MKRVYLVRHGQTEGNLGKYFQDSETPLTDAGVAGAQAVAQRLSQVQVDTLFASPYKRAQQTAEAISKICQLPIITIDSVHELTQPTNIRGIYHDSPEGLEHLKNHTDNFYNPARRPEGAENIIDIQKRVTVFLSELSGRKEEHIVVVSHASFIRLIVASILSGVNAAPASHMTVYKSLRGMSNVGITQLRYEEFHENDWQLFMYNDHAHFAE